MSESTIPTDTPLDAFFEDSFPRLQARTLRFTLGAPKAFTVTPDGSRVLFVRTASGTSRTAALWSFDVDTGSERLIADPGDLLGDAGEQLSHDERARRERSRESGAGIVAYALDASGTQAAFALSGGVWVADIALGVARSLPTVGAAIDPRIDPTGRHIAYASGGALRVIGADGEGERVLVEPDGDQVCWGQAEFVAAEEMQRYRGFWWAPDGASLLVERYDNSPVDVWHVADPANPAVEPVAHRYPAAGTNNADVSLWQVRLDGGRREIAWDSVAFPYLTRVSWSSNGPALVQVMSRDQRVARVLSLDVETGDTTMVSEQRDDRWVDLVVGVPAYGPNGRLVTCVDSEDTRRLAFDGEPVTKAGIQVRDVLSVDADGVLVSCSLEPTEGHLLRVGWDGRPTWVTREPGVNSGASGGGTTVVSHSSLDRDGARIYVSRGGAEVGEIANLAEHPGFRPSVTALAAGAHQLRTAVLFPRDHVQGSQQLPVLMDPYGGPHAQRVVASSRAFLESQWLADQGFCVIVADGRGTPARGPAWERMVHDDIAAVTLQDQVDALAAVAEAYPDDVDTSRVGITGWSYGGYLAILAVLARPDVFHAAVAGAPVTEWRLYDTFYTERYLGHPGEQPGVYDATSLLPLADRLERPLMIIHGMVDDNVVVAHSLRLSSALLAAGKAHTVLPLTGVTHMTPQEVVAENIKLLSVDFLHHALA